MKTRDLVAALTLIVVLGVPAGSGAVTIILDSQYREVSATAVVWEQSPMNPFFGTTLDKDSESFETSATGFWGATASVEAAYCVSLYCDPPFGSGPDHWAGASVTQNSIIDLAADGSGLAIELWQSADAWVNDDYLLGFHSSASVANYFAVLFTLDDVADYYLDLNYWWDNWGTAPITLTDMTTGQTIFDYMSSQSAFDAGQLEAHQYLFAVETDFNLGNQTGPYGSMFVDLHVSGAQASSGIVPEPATLFLFGSGLVGVGILGRKLLG